ncbi:MAG: elongation factor P maturation arginine rhamnosyltransferase EarP [Spirochaetaceae bacterium]|nr:elongation factor P maturation arginine rhamnosyltransferase EarP [Spirochaetaceae bacterium]
MRDEFPFLDILCKVVDNFGDIGVVYRLARALAEADPSLRLRLVVDGLEAFKSLAPGIDPALEVQDFRGWRVYRWDLAPGPAREEFRREPPRRAVECFACGKPDWYEELVFDPADPAPRRILNLEYLTAEDYAVDFHRLVAATRSDRVRKFFFMPGFAPGTGGLLLDRNFLAARARFLDPASRPSARLAALRAAGFDAGLDAAAPAAAPVAAPTAAPADSGGRRWVAVFSYERDYGRIVADLAAHARERPLLALVAAGRSELCFRRAWEEAGRPFPALFLPFLPQETWDELLLAADFAIVRGEESLARAALSGRPFLWHAYVQEEAHQLVKVRALLERLRPCFEPALFAPLEELFLAFNDRLRDGPAVAGTERLLPLLEAAEALKPGFEAFSERLLALGNLADNLLTFFGEIG